jgi:hypothetical protein
MGEHSFLGRYGPLKDDLQMIDKLDAALRFNQEALSRPCAPLINGAPSQGEIRVLRAP